MFKLYLDINCIWSITFSCCCFFIHFDNYLTTLSILSADYSLNYFSNLNYTLAIYSLQKVTLFINTN